MTSPNDPSLVSWIPVEPESDFPIQNLPFGVFQRQGRDPVVGVAIGSHVLDLAELEQAGLLDVQVDGGQSVFDQPTLNPFISLGQSVWRKVRERVSVLLRESCAELRDNRAMRESVLVAQDQVHMHLPVNVRNFVDFYSSKYHATNVGSMFRDPSNPLLPNWVHLPVAYNGRSSSVIGTDVAVRRPCGQTKADDQDQPVYGPCRLLDFELEVGFITGPANELGSSVPVQQAEQHIFGLVLVNDWSARDIQKWEYVPLGPFLGKSFATSISPWVVTLDALDPFRVPGPKQDPEVLPYLQCEGDWAHDMELEVHLKAAGMDEPQRIVHSNYKHMYWNLLQQLAHVTVNGTNVEAGDLYASGTVSGPEEHSRGCMLELCWKGTKPIELSNGEQRKFIADGDEVIMRGWCQADGYRVGFGELANLVVPAS